MNLSVEGPRRTFMLQKIMNALVTLKQISSSTVFPYFCAFFVDISQEKFSMITAKICLQNLDYSIPEKNYPPPEKVWFSFREQVPFTHQEPHSSITYLLLLVLLKVLWVYAIAH